MRPSPPALSPLQLVVALTLTLLSLPPAAHIEGVRQVLDPNPMPPGLHQHSLIIKTRDRDIAFTASSKERHDLWYNAVQYLLSRPDGVGSASSATAASAVTPTARRTRSRTVGGDESISNFFALPSASASDSRLTPRAHQPYSSQTLPAKSSRPLAAAASSESHDRRRASGILLGTPRSLRSFGGRPIDDEDGSLEVVDRNDVPYDYEHRHGDDEGFEGLENLRSCCDGAHDGASRSSLSFLAFFLDTR